MRPVKAPGSAFRGRRQRNTPAERRKKDRDEGQEGKVRSAASPQTREETHRKVGDGSAGKGRGKVPRDILSKP